VGEIRRIAELTWRARDVARAKRPTVESSKADL
jgi:hypothetical protein